MCGTDRGLWFSGTTDRAPFPGLSEEERTRHKGELVYPNLMVSLSPDHVAAFRLCPFDVGLYAPMEDLALDIRRYVGVRLGPAGGQPSVRSRTATPSTTSEPR